VLYKPIELPPAGLEEG
jgi:hypothetical protein